MQTQSTKSEILFREYCSLRGYVANRIPAPADGSQFPDYEVLVGKDRVIAEVKELQANPDDEVTANIVQQHVPKAFGDEPGRRVRKHIEKAERQLRRYNDQQVPCLVVLYENIIVNGFRPYQPGGFLVDPMHPLFPGNIDVGMYGLQAVRLRIHQDGRSESLGDVRGGKRTLRFEHQDNISAIVTLHDYAPDYGLFLIVYHNFFAKNPLPKTVFADSKDKHLEKPGHPESCPGEWRPTVIPEDNRCA
jgi:hypothetical protein